MIGVETMTVKGDLLDKTMLLIQEIAVKGEALESIFPLQLPEAITTMRFTSTSI